MWQAVRRKQISGLKFYRQFPVFHDLTGRETFFIADFFCHESSLIVELDGPIHEHRLPEDAERTEILRHLGLRVIRFRNEEVMRNLDAVLTKIRRAAIGNRRVMM